MARTTPEQGAPNPGSAFKESAAADVRANNPSVAQGPEAAQRADQERRSQQARTIREGLFPSLVATAIGHAKFFESSAYKVFLDQFVNDAAESPDPIERLLIEQLALAHFRIGDLHCSAAASGEGIDAVKVYASAASRLLGEFRRSVLALKAYRLRPTKLRSGQTPAGDHVDNSCDPTGA
jgi:hypothetical protein